MNITSLKSWAGRFNRAANHVNDLENLVSEFHEKYSPDIEGDAFCDCIIKIKDKPNQVRALCQEILEKSTEDPMSHFNAYTNHPSHVAGVPQSGDEGMIDPLRARAASGPKDASPNLKPHSLMTDEEKKQADHAPKPNEPKPPEPHKPTTIGANTPPEPPKPSPTNVSKP